MPMRPLLVLTCLSLLLTACATEPSEAPVGDESGSTSTTDETSAAPEPASSPASPFVSSVGTRSAAVQSDVALRVAETIARFDGRIVEDGTLLTVPAEILFDVDVASLRPDAAATLDSLVEVVEFHGAAPLAVTGHTDSDGTDAYNDDLSLRRARAVADHLTASGVDAERIRTSGRSEQEPVAPNDTEQGRQQNRRVELLLIGVDETPDPTSTPARRAVSYTHLTLPTN